MRTITVLACLVVLTACTGERVQHIISQQVPPVSASNGGSAELLIEACAGTKDVHELEQELQRILITLQSAGMMVVADSGSAKLVIDFCEGGGGM